MLTLETPQSRCRCGVARDDITPPVGIYHRMWGAATHDQSTGVHRPLTATALWLAPESDRGPGQDGGPLALLAIDHCILWGLEIGELLDKLATASGMPSDRTIVLFSHTHAAGLMGRERAGLPGGELIAPYLDELAGKLAALVDAARRSGAQPAVLRYGVGRCSLARNRDLWDADSNQWVCGLNPAGPADDTVLVVDIGAAGGATLATVVNYACHPTTLAWDNTLISPDYVGALRQVVEPATAAPCFFIQGASGDLGPRDGYVGDTAVADRNGRQLGYSVLSAWEALPPAGTRQEYTGPVVSGAVIGTWAHRPLPADAWRRKQQWRFKSWTFDLPYRAGLVDAPTFGRQRQECQAAEEAARAAGRLEDARVCRAQVEVLTRQLVRLQTLPAGKSYPFPIRLWRLGDAVWVFIEAEHYQVLQTRLRERFAGSPLVIATLAGGRLPTYLPPANLYGTGVYQETIALLEAGCLERLIDEIGQQIDQWLNA